MKEGILFKSLPEWSVLVLVSYERERERERERREGV
jgi:hypothetical protein